MKTIRLFFAFLLISNISLFSQNLQERIKISNDLELIKLSPNSFVHVSHAVLSPFGKVASNGLIFMINKKAILFDTPPNDSLTRELLDFINDSLHAQVVDFIPNHWHIDCMGGIETIIKAGIKTYGNEMTLQIAKEKGILGPENGFKDSLVLNFETSKVYCYYLGAAHSLDNIVVWIPSEKVLFPGCMVKELSSQNLGNTADGDLKEYPVTIEKILKKIPDVLYVVPGHGLPGGIELIRHTEELANSAGK